MSYGEWHGSRMKCDKCGEFKEIRYLYLCMEVRCKKCGEEKSISWKK